MHSCVDTGSNLLLHMSQTQAALEENNRSQEAEPMQVLVQLNSRALAVSQQIRILTNGYVRARGCRMSFPLDFPSALVTPHYALNLLLLGFRPSSSNLTIMSNCSRIRSISA